MAFYDNGGIHRNAVFKILCEGLCTFDNKSAVALL